MTSRVRKWKTEKLNAEYLILYLVTINAVTFCMYGIDKWQAVRGGWRISEAVLLWAAVFGGSIGAWLGVVVFHHKTLHASFRYGVPLILLAQVVLAAWIILDKL